MQDSNWIIAQEARRIESSYRGTIAKHCLRGISTFLVFIYQEGDPQCDANAVPYEAQTLIRMKHDVLELTLRQIENHLARPDDPRAEIAALALNEACVDAVIAAIWRRRQCGFRVLEPDLKWLTTVH